MQLSFQQKLKLFFSLADTFSYILYVTSQRWAWCHELEVLVQRSISFCFNVKLLIASSNQMKWKLSYDEKKKKFWGFSTSSHVAAFPEIPFNFSRNFLETFFHFCSFILFEIISITVKIQFEPLLQELELSWVESSWVKSQFSLRWIERKGWRFFFSNSHRKELMKFICVIFLSSFPFL